MGGSVAQLVEEMHPGRRGEVRRGGPNANFETVKHLEAQETLPGTCVKEVVTEEAGPVQKSA